MTLRVIAALTGLFLCGYFFGFATAALCAAAGQADRDALELERIARL